jgi:putative ABC transport system permease protein
MNLLLQDVGYAIRILRKQIGVTSVAVIVMALGISLTASMYAIIKGVLFSAPDYEAVEDIVYVRTTIPLSQFNQSVRIHDYLDWREQQTVFEEMAAYYNRSVNLSGDDLRAETYRGVRLTASTFDLLGRQPLLGRPFTPDQDLVPDQNEVIIAYHIWEDRYGADPDILGKTIRVNARPTTVIGVMPDGFRFPERQDMWLPLAIDMAELERRDGPGLQVLGRLPDGSTQADAFAQFTAIASRLEQQFPDTNKDIVPVMESWTEAQFVDDDTRSLLYTMFVGVFGVLLIACANVANLLFALTVARGKELAVRTALGAARFRVLRQLLSETLVLAAGGAVVGLVLTKFSLDLFTRVVTPLEVPPWITFDVSPAVVMFVIGVTFLSALISGILPALQATRGDIHSILQDQSRGSSGRSVSKRSAALVVLEVSLSLALLVAAGLTVRSTMEIANADFGIEQAGILTARVLLPGATYEDSLARRDVTDRLRTELGTIPGVTEVAVTSNMPVLGTGLYFYGVQDHGYADDSEYRFGGYTRVSPTFFDLIGAQIVAGRGIDETDVLGSRRVVVLDQRFVERNWPGEDALGKQVRLGRSDSENPWHTVVGVVRTIDMLEPLQFAADPPENMFAPLAQNPVAGLSVMLKTNGDPLLAAMPVRDVITRIDSDIPVNRVATFEQRIKVASVDTVIIGGMFAIFGVVALLLASIGLYAVMAFSVGRRTAEVGIRMALGANSGSIVRLILRQSMWPLGAGIVLGLGLAALLGQALSSFLFNVNALDPMTFVGIPLLLLAVSLAALLIPANRAARIAPVVALREE